MKPTFKVSLKADERIYINGAVIRVDRKTSLEFLNNVNFLLENHVLQANNADTPLKQLYYIVQIMLMNPGSTETAFNLYRAHLMPLLNIYDSARIVNELKNVDKLVHETNYYEAMKNIRDLFNLEAELLSEPDGFNTRRTAAAAQTMAAPGERLSISTKGAA